MAKYMYCPEQKPKASPNSKAVYSKLDLQEDACWILDCSSEYPLQLQPQGQCIAFTLSEPCSCPESRP